jgi:hypothetical protein
MDQAETPEQRRPPQSLYKALFSLQLQVMWSALSPELTTSAAPCIHPTVAIPALGLHTPRKMDWAL